MIINKAQGQTFSIIGLDLCSPVFSHGMLYVAASRVGSRSKLHVHAPDKKTRNVVLKKCAAVDDRRDPFVTKLTPQKL